MEHSRGFQGAEPGVIAAGVYLDGKRVADVPIDEAGAWSRKPGHVVWIGLLEPSRELLLRVQDQFGLHDLAMTDAATPHGYPKVEQYGDALFVVARTAQLVDRRVALDMQPRVTVSLDRPDHQDEQEYDAEDDQRDHCICLQRATRLDHRISRRLRLSCSHRQWDSHLAHGW